MYRDQIPRCPRCRHELARYDARDKWRCRSCQGTLIGPSELVLEIGERGEGLAEGRAPAGVAGDAAIGCPVCEAGMRKLLIDDVAVDRCAEHGVWFDGGELGRLRQAIASREATPPLVQLYDSLLAERERKRAAGQPAASLPHVAPLVVSAEEWRNRRLCPDGSCIGLIGEGNRCKICGRRALR